MGEYWKPVNLSKREYVHPHRVGDGLKLGEWNYPGSSTRKRVDELLAAGQWSPADDIRIVSDYGQEMQMYGYPNPAYVSTEGDDDDNLYSLAGQNFTDVSAPGDPSPQEGGAV